MARNRMIKPKFWDDAKIGKISRDARLVYIGMWNFCDDLGVVRADSVWLKSKIFPFDQMQIQQFDKICQEILRNGFISLFSYRDEKFYYLPKFSLHQTINKPNYEDVNVPKDVLFNGLSRITEQSRINHGTITEQSIPKIEEEIEGEYNNIPPYNPPEGIGVDELIQRENELKNKEAELNAKEQELLKREAALKVQTESKLPDISFVSDDFKDVFSLWLEYKREKRESYKSKKSLETCYKKLLELSNNNPETARLIVEQSMASNWSGIFKLRDGSIGAKPFSQAATNPAGKVVCSEAKAGADIQSSGTPQKDYSARF